MHNDDFVAGDSDHNRDASREEPNETKGDRYSFPSEPPTPRRPQRRSWWAEVFEEFRQHPGEWRMVDMPFARSTAQQLASDVRNSHRRTPERMRNRGLRGGERWEARYAPDPNGEAGSESYRVWLRYIGMGEVV